MIDDSRPGDSRVSYGRLQRPPTAYGYRVDSFADVLRRHGFAMGCVAAICLLLPQALATIAATTARPLLQPLPYLAALCGLLVFFVYWSARRSVPAGQQVRWVFYLLYISIVEELAFRLLLPAMLSQSCSWLAAIVLSNAAFAAIHYFTLRWKLRNCLATFLGGMGLSQLMTQGDLTLVVMVHWLGTFLNTPYPPAGQKELPEAG